MREHPIGKLAELMTFMLTTTSEVTLVLGVLEVADGVGDRESLEFLDAFQEVHPLWRVGVLITKVIEILCTQ